MLINRFFFTLLVVISLAGISQVAAQCSRSDINYYLSKGFSQEQIAEICSGTPAKPRYESSDKHEEKIQRQRENERRYEDDRFFLRSAINGWDIILNADILEYTRKFCISVGKTPEVEARTRVCPDVRYRIHFDGLEIRNAERKYDLIGQREVNVTGKVGKKLLHDFKEYPSDLEQQLIHKYKTTIRKGGTYIPVRKDTSLNRVVTILREYAGRATRKEQ